MCIHICVYIYICMCIYIYTHAHMHTPQNAATHKTHLFDIEWNLLFMRHTSLTATHCLKPQHTATHNTQLLDIKRDFLFARDFVDCYTLQYAAIHCKTLQDTARHCKTLQHARLAFSTSRGISCSRVTSLILSLSMRLLKSEIRFNTLQTVLFYRAFLNIIV